jgi:hypothetical protein
MMPFEKRLAHLETAGNMRFQGRQVGVIFDADEADIDASFLRYKRTREASETPDEFQHRVASTMSRNRRPCSERISTPGKRRGLFVRIDRRRFRLASGFVAT